MPPQFLGAQPARGLVKSPINGYPDGTFKPEANVTYAEALKMILCALGYTPETFRNIVWPTTWIAKAIDLDITDGVPLATGAVNLPANRADIARLVDNALTVPKLIQMGYGDEVKYVVSGKEGTDEETLLGGLGYEKVSGRVVDIHLTDSDLDENEVRIGSETYTLPEGADAVSLLGLEVKVWADDDNNVAFWQVSTAADDVIYDFVSGLTDGGVKLLLKNKEYAWADKATKLVNFEPGTVEAGQYGRFVLDDDGDVAFAVLLKFDSDINGGMVTEATAERVKYAVETSSERLDYGDYDAVHVFSPQLASAKVEDIKADSLIYGWADDNLYLLVAGEKKEGELEAASADKITVAGTSYNLPVAAWGATPTYSEDEDETILAMEDGAAAALENLVGEDVTLLVGLDGRVRHVRGTAVALAGVQFGVALSGTEATFDGAARVKVLTKNGVATYAFEDADDYAKGLNLKVSDFNDGETNVVIAFKLNADGEIADDQIAWADVDNQKLTWVGYNEDEDPDWEGPAWVSQYGVDKWETPTADKDDDSISEGGDVAYVTSSTVLFNEIGKADKYVTTIAWSDIEDKNLAQTVDSTSVTLAVVRKTTNLDAVAVWFTAGYDLVVSEALYGVVLDSPWRTSAGWKVEIDVYGEGEKEYLLASDALKDALQEGTAVKFGLDAAGKINRVFDDGDVVSGAQVKAVSGSYVTLVDEAVYRVATGAVMYLLDENNAIDVAIDVGDLKQNDTVDFVLKSKSIMALVKRVVSVPSTPPVPEEPFTAATLYSGRVVDLSVREDAEDIEILDVTKFSIVGITGVTAYNAFLLPDGVTVRVVFPSSVGELVSVK